MQCVDDSGAVGEPFVYDSAPPGGASGTADLPRTGCSCLRGRSLFLKTRPPFDEDEGLAKTGVMAVPGVHTPSGSVLQVQRSARTSTMSQGRRCPVRHFPT